MVLFLFLLGGGAGAGRGGERIGTVLFCFPASVCLFVCLLVAF